MKLKRTIGGGKPDDKPEMYDSLLFSRHHPKKGESQKSTEEIPDPRLESIEPNEDDKPVDTSSSMGKAIDLLKSFSKADPKPEEPDTTGKLEGKFAIPLNQMIGWLNKIISAEYTQWLRYYHYGMVLRGQARDAIAEEFEEHAEQELGHVAVIGLRVVGLGGYPIPAIDRPSPLKKTEDILKEMLYHEQQGMALYKQVLGFCGENEGTRQIIESNIEVEQEHIDELWRWLKCPEEVNKADMSAGKNTKPSDKQAKREYDHSFARQIQGESGQPTPDLPDRGRDWHGTVPGVPDEPQDGEEEEDQKEAQSYFKLPKDFLKQKSHNDEAIKALAGVARFSSGPVMPPREAEFMLQNGYTPEEIDNGAVMTPRLRAEFNRFIANSVHKSIRKFGR
jgi:bacterioferritin